MLELLLELLELLEQLELPEQLKLLEQLEILKQLELLELELTRLELKLRLELKGFKQLEPVDNSRDMDLLQPVKQPVLK